MCTVTVNRQTIHWGKKSCILLNSLEVFIHTYVIVYTYTFDVKNQQNECMHFEREIQMILE